MKEYSRIEEFTSIFGHRLTDTVNNDGKWIVWGCVHSTQTMAKFIRRAKKEGFSSAFCRDYKVGVLVRELE